MDQATLSGHDARGDSGRSLARADRRLSAGVDALERLVVLGPCRLIDDETVARVRALVGDLAAQLAGPDHALVQPVAEMLAVNRAILAHCHALAVEWRLAMRLAARLTLDPVLPPLVQAHAAAMMPLIAAQTRSLEATRRMGLVLDDLPADLLHLAHAVVRAARADWGVTGHVDAPSRPDEAHGRLALLHDAVAGLGDDRTRALRIDEAGVSLFFTALAMASATPRETVVIAAAEDDPVRLLAVLNAAGLAQADIARQLLALRPDAELPAEAAR